MTDPTGKLFIYQPNLVDRIDPLCFAIPGQVVQVEEVVSTNALHLTTPDGKTFLGTVSIKSLQPFPLRGDVHYEQNTGMTDDARNYVC